MPQHPSLLSRCLHLLTEQDLAVLATCPAASEGTPLCSLMAYTLAEDTRHLLLVSPAGSRKVAYLQQNPHASVLVDTRTTAPREAVQALTVSVLLAPPPPHEVPALLHRFLARHPRLEAFARRPETVLLRLRMTSLQLLDDVETAHFLQLEE
ncbi:pyridoxamine 5'-phosphate oxidase family protein [Megalodesulfovibrio paquesii]